MKLNDNSFTPLYQQVLEDIKASIANGSYPPGTRIPSEAELSQLYDVSRVTVRRAIEELSGEGYLTKRQGKGTYVNQRKMTRKIRQSSSIKSFTDVCTEIGMAAGARVLERRVVLARTEELRFFGDNHDRLVYVSRLRTADGTPIMEEHNLFPFDEFAFLLDAQLEDTSVFDLIARTTGRTPSSCSLATIEIALADASMAGNLDVSVGAPLFFEHVLFNDQNGRPFALSNKYLVGSRYMFDI